jgi:aspartate 1-decarboxylase
MLRAKIHGLTITHSDLSYEGSISIPTYLLEASDLLANEEVHVWNVTNGARFQTYVIPGRANSGDVAINRVTKS